MILLAPLVITAAIASPLIGPVLNVDPAKADSIAIQCGLAYGSGGTTIDAYLQTSFDDGATWVDIANFHMTTANFSKLINLSSMTPVTTSVTPTDGAMTANTAQDGLIGSKLRVKYKSAGTYAANTTLAIYANGGGLRAA